MFLHERMRSDVLDGDKAVGVSRRKPGSVRLMTYIVTKTSISLNKTLSGDKSRANDRKEAIRLVYLYRKNNFKSIIKI